MHDYKNLLYVSFGTNDETEGLKQALSLARNNDAALHILVIAPEFPEALPAEYRQKYEESLLSQIESSINQSKEAIKVVDKTIDVEIRIISNKTPGVKVIQEVIKNNFDLIIKEAQSPEAIGFKALDMYLLRNSPVPLWLCRPIKKSRCDINIAVAIDPEGDAPSVKELSKSMLLIARSLADDCSGDLSIISCWDYELEEYLRHSTWIKTTEEELTKEVNEAKNKHYHQLQELIKESGISSSKYQVHHLRGKPDEAIPNFVQDSNINILVMGTLGRSGIRGLIIGNTSENILQKLNCSLLALKPKEFVSPVQIDAG